MNKHEKVVAYIEKAAPAQREVLSALRALIANSSKLVQEDFKWGRPVYRMSEDICYLQVTKNYVNLGFFNYMKIEDPRNLLEGTGDKMRHVKFKQVDEVDGEVIGAMIKQAI